MYAPSQAQQPRGFWAIFVLQVLLMVGFGMVFSLVVLYATNKLGMTKYSAYAISASFNALTFAMSVPGGYFAERFLGFRFAAVLSIVLSGIGLLLMVIPSVTMLYVGLGVFVFANGMIVPCLYVLLGRLYPKDTNLRDSGFVLTYVGMNVGALFAEGLSGTIAEFYGYHIAFIMGAIAAFLMVPVFCYYQKLFVNQESAMRRAIINNRSRVTGLILVAISVALSAVLIDYARVCNALLLILGVACIILVLRIASKAKTTLAKHKLWVFLILTVMSVIFWTLYTLTPSAITIFSEFNVNRHVLGFTIPTADLTGFNPLFIITMGPVLNLVWRWCHQRGVQVSTSYKFAFGIVLMGVGYLVLVLGISLSSTLGFMALSWLVLSYFLQTVGELMIGPVGYAMVGKLVPLDKEGLMMGIWQLATGVAGALSEYFANYTVTPGPNHNPIITNAGYEHAFLVFGLLTVVIGVATLAMAPKLHKIQMRQAN